MSKNPIALSLVRENLDQDRDERYFHPSEATGCSLQIWFRKMEARGFLKYPGVPFDANLLAIFKVGHLIHAWLQEVVVEYGLCGPEGIEAPIKDEERKITGSIDILLEERDDMEYHDIFPAGPKRVVDIKSCSWKSFSTHRYPERAHVIQTSIYCHYVGAEDISILYLCKDGGSFDMWIDEIGIESARKMGIILQHERDPFRLPLRVVHFKKDDAAVQAAFEKFATIQEAIERKVPPMPEYDPRERFAPCQSCPYRYHCREETRREHPGLGLAPWDRL